jgi:hypothetical protein
MAPSDHRKGHPLCGSKKKQGAGTCRREAGWGTSHPGTGHCKIHGGSTPGGTLYAAKQEVAIMGREIDLTPAEGLLLCVRIAAGEVGYCTQRIGDLVEGQEYEQTKREKTVTYISKQGEAAGGVIETEDVEERQLNVWIRMRQSCTDRLAKYAKMALDAGVAERQVRLAEQQGAMIAEILRAVLTDLKVDLSAPDTRAVVRRHLMAAQPKDVLTATGLPE